MKKSFLTSSVLAGYGLMTGLQAAPQQKPNVLLIVCDDLNDYVTGFGGHPQARTPHIEKFAKTATAFRRAYSNCPVCAPSRSSFLTGIAPWTSRALGWPTWYKHKVLKNCYSLAEQFRRHGYRVVGSGKLMHHVKPELWDEYPHKPDYGPFVFDGKKRVAHPSVPEPFRSIGPVDGSFAPLEDIPFANDNNPKSGWIYGTWGKIRPFQVRPDGTRSLTPDEINAKWAAERLHRFAAERSDKPFFMGVGFIRPHTPLH
ncbi:MAG: hypothetical protein D6820_14620, partial [Lentisphaerae bacterium]